MSRRSHQPLIGPESCSVHAHHPHGEHGDWNRCRAAGPERRVAASGLDQWSARNGPPREVSVGEAQERMKDGAVLIDVREDNEFAARHAAGSRHMARGIIERDIVQTVPDKGTELILYCGGGYRSALSADMLQKMGYTNVWSMAGGWHAWEASGAPTE